MVLLDCLWKKTESSLLKKQLNLNDFFHLKFAVTLLSPNDTSYNIVILSEAS